MQGTHTTIPIHVCSYVPTFFAVSASSRAQDLSAKPPPGSCRSGAVVHLQHANGSKVPVTLQLSNHDDGEHMQHVIKVRGRLLLLLLRLWREGVMQARSTAVELSWLL